jgi:hypothetical protein
MAADELAPRTTDADRVRAYPDDPVGFARDILGITLWSRQIEIVESVTRHKRVAVVSGHRLGKSWSLAILAIWFYCSFPKARVVIMAATDRQVNSIIWRAVRQLCRQARVPIPGYQNIKLRAMAGLTDLSDFSEIKGYSAKTPEAVAGIAGPSILYLVDEASGVPDEIFEAIEGNRAGGSAWVFLIGNPTKSSGEFFDAFHKKSSKVLGSAGYHTIHIDSRESPNCTGEWQQLGDKPIKGLADPEWVADKLREWGEDDPRFKIRIAGKFSVAEAAKIFPLALIADANKRWDVTKDLPQPKGRLYIGVDPAGDGTGGDESGFCARIGDRVLELVARAGLSPQQHIEQIETLIAKCRKGGPLPVVVLESEGETGAKVYSAVREYNDASESFVLCRLRTSDKPRRQAEVYDRLRDEMWGNARQWVRDGGCFPLHAKLEDDLHAPEFYSTVTGRLKVTSKRDLRKLLGRSPDVADAFVMSLWEPLHIRQEDAAVGSSFSEVAVPERAYDPYAPPPFDPYSGLDAFRR